MITESEIQAAIPSLLKSAGLNGDFSLHPVPGGGNNRGYRIELDRSRYFLKAYFRHENDPRDRLDSEFRFTQFAWNQGLRALPQPLARDSEHGMGLYEFVEGRRLQASEITEEKIRIAVDFFREVNRHKEAPEAQMLPIGSEACFSLASHLRCVDRRLQMLEAVKDASPIDGAARDFIQNEMKTIWARIKEAVNRSAGGPAAMERELTHDERCLSPSDFGFHNALLTPEGRIRFLDFEYAGWDDAAKMVCDFLCHVGTPIPRSLHPFFIDIIVNDISKPEILLRRIALLRPVYQVKWCCILLNEFIKVGADRRRFASSPEVFDAVKEAQLAKARAMFGQIDLNAAPFVEMRVTK
ncbi:MAG: aminoglycoside phosphotransferase family protein [Candidatus Omnitrophota bacterium]